MKEPSEHARTRSIERIVEREDRRRKRILWIYAPLLIIPLALGTVVFVTQPAESVGTDPRVDEMASELPRLAEESSEIARANRAQDARLEDLRNRAAALETRALAAYDPDPRLVNRVEILHDTVAVQGERLARQEERVAQQEERVAQQGERLLRLDRTVRGLEERLGRVEDRIGRLGEPSSSVTPPRDGLDARLAEIERRLRVLANPARDE